MSNKGGRNDGARGRGEKTAGHKNLSFDEFKSNCPLGLEDDMLQKCYNETKNNRDAVQALIDRLWADPPPKEEAWTHQTGRKKETTDKLAKPITSASGDSSSNPAKNNNNNNNNNREGIRNYDTYKRERDGAGVRPYISLGGGGAAPRREGGVAFADRKPKLGDNNKTDLSTALAPPAAVNTAIAPGVVQQAEVHAAAADPKPASKPATAAANATGANNKTENSILTGESYSSRVQKNKQLAELAKELAAQAAQAERDQAAAAAAAAAAAKEQKKRDDKASISKKKSASPREEHSSSEASASVPVASAVVAVVETVSAPPVVVAQTDPVPTSAAKKETKVEASIPQLEQSFNNISTTDPVLNSIPAETPSAIVNTQISNENELKQKSSSYTFGNLNSNSLASPAYSSFTSNNQTQGWASTSDAVTFNNQVSVSDESSLFKPGNIEVTSNSGASNKPPGLSKEPSHTSRDQRHGHGSSHKTDGQHQHQHQHQHAPLAINMQQQQHQQQQQQHQQQQQQQQQQQMGGVFNYGQQPYPQHPRYDAPGYPPNMTTPYPMPQAPSGGLNNISAPVPGANLSSQQQQQQQQGVIPGAFGGQGSAPAQGQLQGQLQGQGQGQMSSIPQQGNYNAGYWPHQYYGFPPHQYYGHYIPGPQYPYRNVPRGQGGSYENQYQGGDYAPYYNVDHTAGNMPQPSSQPSSKQGKANGGGAPVNNAQPQADHSAAQNYTYPRGAPYGYDNPMNPMNPMNQQWTQQMYTPNPNNQPPGMAGGMRADGAGNSRGGGGGGNVPMNHNQANFQQSYTGGNRGQQNNNNQQNNANYNLPYNP